MYQDEPKDSGSGLLYGDLIEYPVWIGEGSVMVRVDSPEHLPEAMKEFTRQFFSEVMKRPGIELDPRAFLRLRTTQDSKKPRSLCPFSFPTEIWAKLALEQVVMDTGGMQVRYLRNDRPWLEQPAIYTDVVQTVSHARTIASDWLEDRKKDDKTK